MPVKFYLILAGFILSYGARAQQTVNPGPSAPVDTASHIKHIDIPSLLDSIARNYPEEKVHLQLDRDRYFAGDTIWFKGYLFCGGTPGHVSTGLHVELYNAAGARVEAKYFPVFQGGMTAGELELPDSLSEGVYTLCAYTGWMANFDPVYFYRYSFPVYRAHATPPVKPVAVAHAVQAVSVAYAVQPVAPAAPVARDFDVQFLPEGGTAVEGVRSHMAFTATDGLGNPLSLEGRVMDDAGDTVALFHSVHDGMGAFDYTPVKGMGYTAFVETRLGEKRIALPPADPDGLVLHTTFVPGGVQVHVRIPDSNRFLGQALKVVGNMYGHMIYLATAHPTRDAEDFEGKIRTDQLPDGILQITVFDEAGAPLAERVVFVQPTPLTIPVSLSLDTLDTAAKALNAWTLHFPDSVRGSFSLSVTDADAAPLAQGQGGILSDLLLTEDLRGTIYDPEWYFRDTADSTREALDLVMQTHGWRRFDWKKLETGSFPSIRYTDSEYLHFNGRAYYAFGKKPICHQNLNVLLQIPGEGTQMLVVPVDSGGHFIIRRQAFFDTASAYFQVNKEGNKGKDVRLILDAVPGSSLLGNLPLPHYNPPVFPGGDSALRIWGTKQKDIEAQIHRFNHAKELQEIIVKGNKDDPMAQLQAMDDEYAFGLFSNTDGYAFDIVHHPEYEVQPNIIQFLLEGHVPSLQFITGPPDLLKFRGQGSPAFFLDEMPTDLNTLLNIPMMNIAYAKFILPPFMGARLGGANGAIAVYTRKGMDLLNPEQGLNRLTLKGYSPIRQFYTPKYDRRSGAAATDQPDYRITLDWEPWLSVNGDVHTAVVRFYNNDHSHRFRVVAEDMDEKGKLLHFEEVVGD